VSARLYHMDVQLRDAEAGCCTTRPVTAHVTVQTRSCLARCIHHHEVGVDTPFVWQAAPGGTATAAVGYMDFGCRMAAVPAQVAHSQGESAVGIP